MILTLLQWCGLEPFISSKSGYTIKNEGKKERDTQNHYELSSYGYN